VNVHDKEKRSQNRPLKQAIW